MSLYETVKKALQDVVAPDLKELKGDLKVVDAKVDNLEEIMGLRFDAINQRLDDLKERLDLHRRIENIERARDEESAH